MLRTEFFRVQCSPTELKGFFVRVTGVSDRSRRLRHGRLWFIVVLVSDLFVWPGFLETFAEAAEAAGFRKIPFGMTEAGELVAWEKSGPGLRVYISAGIHGDEPAGPLAVLEMVRSGFFGPEGNWALCPALNPTGLAAGTRENVDGEDLNRDYWTRRTGEVASHIEWLKSTEAPSCFISLHEDWETNGFYFYEINCGEDCPERAHSILNAVSPWFPPEPAELIDGHAIREQGWIYHVPEADLPENWPEAIFLAKSGCCLSFTFETPSSAGLRDRVAAHVAAVEAALAIF